MDTEKSLINEVENELLEAENILNTEYSFELAEPNYIRCLKVLRRSPDLQPKFEALLIYLFETKKVSDEPIAYLMHVLRWPEIRIWMESRLKKLLHPIADGASFEKVISAYSDTWENREFYKWL